MFSITCLNHFFVNYYQLVDIPTSTTALKRSPYLIVNKMSLKGYEDVLYQRVRLRLPKTKPCQDRTYRVGHNKTIRFYHRKNHGNSDGYEDGADCPNTMLAMCYRDYKEKKSADR